MSNPNAESLERQISDHELNRRREAATLRLKCLAVREAAAEQNGRRAYVVTKSPTFIGNVLLQPGERFSVSAAHTPHHNWQPLSSHSGCRPVALCVDCDDCLPDQPEAA